MARAGLLLLKWLLIPAALAAAGYYIVGPRVGKYVQASPDKPQIETTAVQAPTSSDATQTSYPQPEVDVKVGTLAHVDRKPRKRRRRTKPKPSVSTPVKVTPPDQGGSGGGATTGGDMGGGGNTGGGDTGGGGGDTGGNGIGRSF